jgi:hypothetical protein
MSIRWKDVFLLPDAAYAGDRRIPKTVLTSRAMLTKREQKTLDKMRRLEHFATVSKGTAQILPCIDEEHDIQSIIFLRCEMAGDSQAVAEVANLLHRCFPNPTVILQESGDDVAISVAMTRKSLAEQGATVVSNVESTGLFIPKDERYSSFLQVLAFDNLPQDDLLSYLHALADCVRLSQAIRPLGFYPRCEPSNHEHLLELVSEYDECQKEVDMLADRRSDKDISPNESARLRMEIIASEKRRNKKLEEIRAICI